MPKVSVIIPTCNRPELLKKALASVLAQTFKDYEVIVVDDGDKVRSNGVIDALSDSRFRYVTNEPPRRGGAHARNKGVKLATGNYIAFLDDDDEWEPNKLAVQSKELDNAPHNVAFSYTGALSVYPDHIERIHITSGVHDVRPMALTRFKGFLTVTLMIKKNVFDEIGGFDESLPSHHDPELILRLSERHLALGLDLPLTRVNMDATREHIGGSLDRRIRGREIVLAKHRDLLKQHPQKLAYHYFQLGIWCRDSGDLKKARSYFFKAFSLSWNPRHLVHGLLSWFRARPSLPAKDMR